MESFINHKAAEFCAKSAKQHFNNYPGLIYFYDTDTGIQKHEQVTENHFIGSLCHDQPVS
jgi:hypothetical protein